MKRNGKGSSRKKREGMEKRRERKREIGGRKGGGL